MDRYIGYIGIWEDRNGKSTSIPTYIWLIDFWQGCQDTAVGNNKILSTDNVVTSGYPHTNE